MAGLKVSDHAVEFIADFEGGQSSDGKFHAYWDQWGKVWTIGYGHIEGVRQGMVWTKSRAEAELHDDLHGKYKRGVDGYIRDAGDLPQLVQDALLSVCYNLGPGYVGKLAHAINTRRYEAAADMLENWDHAGGVRLPGLTRRRRAEAAMIRKGGNDKKTNLEAELARIRAKVKKAGGWRKVPADSYWKRRADSIKRWLAKHK